MKNEIWKDVPGYEGLYQASNFGVVRSIAHYQGRWGKIYKRKKPYILSQSIDKYGYCRVALLKMGNSKFFTVHRLVAMTFIPNPENLPQINHKDENKTNNRVSNLEWCTCKYNSNYGTSRKRSSLAMRNCPSVSKPVQALCDDGSVVTFPSISEVSRQLNISWIRIRRSIILNTKVPNTNLTFKYL